MKFCGLCGNKRKRKKPSCKTRSQYHATRSAAPRNSNELVPPTRSRYIYRFQWEGPQRRTETKIKKKKSHYRAIHQVPSGRREPIRPQLSHPNRAFYSIFLRPERRVIRTLPPPSIKRATGEDTQPAKVKKRPLSTLGNKKKKTRTAQSETYDDPVEKNGGRAAFPTQKERPSSGDLGLALERALVAGLGARTDRKRAGAHYVGQRNLHEGKGSRRVPSPPSFPPLRQSADTGLEGCQRNYRLPQDVHPGTS